MGTDGNPPELLRFRGFYANTDSVVDLKVLFFRHYAVSYGGIISTV